MTRITHDHTIPGMPRAWVEDYTGQQIPVSEPASVPIEMACFAPSPEFAPKPGLAGLIRRLWGLWG